MVTVGDNNYPAGSAAAIDANVGKYFHEFIGDYRGAYGPTATRPRPCRHGPFMAMRWPFESWGASAVFSGHDHDYERLSVGGTPFVVVGTGGQSLSAFVSIAPESRVRLGVHGALLAVATDAALDLEFWTSSGERADSVAISSRCSQ